MNASRKAAHPDPPRPLPPRHPPRPLPPRHPEESERLAALRSYDILDTPAEAAFDDVTRMLAAVCEAPVALISLVDEGRQWFKSEVGLGIKETPLDVSVCGHAILQPGLFIVPDTRADARFACNPLVTGEPYLRFYAGAPLVGADGLPLGTLCVLDYRPRDLTQEQKDTLSMLARTVMTQLDLRRSLAAQSRLLAEKEMLLEELNHRVKNSLQITASLLGLQAREIKDPEARRQFAEASGRIGAVALVHERLNRSEASGRVEVGQYLRDLCADLERCFVTPDRLGSIGVAAEHVELAIEQAVPLALIVNELVTNAFKYAYPDPRAEAVVAVSLRVVEGGAVTLEVEDRGIGLAESFDPEQSTGLGMRLVLALAGQLGGELSYERLTPGARFTLRLPLAAEAGEAARAGPALDRTGKTADE